MKPALLFDLDGTMILSDDLHVRIFIEMFAEHGQEIDAAFYTDRIQGRLNDDIFAEFFPEGDAGALAEEKEARFRARLGGEAPPVAGLPDLLDRADRSGWPAAIVTNAPRANIDAMLGAIGLAGRFATIVVAGELPRGKPDPLPYATALGRLGADPARALAFEDSRSGIRSAAAAGIATIGLRSSLGHDALVSAGASDSIADFTDPGLAPWLDRLTEETT